MTKPAPTDLESWLRLTERRIVLLERRPATTTTESDSGGQGGGPAAGDGLIEAAGVMAVGQGQGVEVSADAVALDTAFTDGRYVNTDGDTMTGPLTLDGDPSSPNQAATKAYVDAHSGGGGGGGREIAGYWITDGLVGESPPPPAIGHVQYSPPFMGEPDQWVISLSTVDADGINRSLEFDEINRGDVLQWSTGSTTDDGMHNRVLIVRDINPVAGGPTDIAQILVQGNPALPSDGARTLVKVLYTDNSMYPRGVTGPPDYNFYAGLDAGSFGVLQPGKMGLSISPWGVSVPTAAMMYCHEYNRGAQWSGTVLRGLKAGDWIIAKHGQIGSSSNAGGLRFKVTGTATKPYDYVWGIPVELQPVGSFADFGFADNVDLVVSAGGGDPARSVSTISTSTTLATEPKGDFIYLCTASLTATLPAATGNVNRYVIKRTGTGAVTIATTGGATIDGASTFTIGTQWQSITVISTGTGWVII